MRPQNFATAERLRPLCTWHRESPWNESSKCLAAGRAPCCEGSAEELTVSNHHTGTHLASESLSDLALTRDGIDTKIRIIPAVGSSGYSRVLVLEAL